MGVGFDTLKNNLLQRRPAPLNLTSYLFTTKRMVTWVLRIMMLEEIRDVVRLDDAAGSPDSGYVLNLDNPSLTRIYPSQ